jgi:hypothetical protein
MAIDTALTQFAEFMGSEVKRVEGLIPTGGDGTSQPTNSPIIYGVGRPDDRTTTNGKITGNEPDGTVYISSDGAGVRAWQWIKARGTWQVSYGDTGEVNMSRLSVNIKSGNIALRRVNNLVQCTFSNGQWDAIYFYGSASPHFVKKSHAKRMDLLPNSRIPQGFRSTKSIMLPFYGDDGEQLGAVYVGGLRNYNYIELRFTGKPPEADMDIVRMPVITWITDDPFPRSLEVR